VARRYVQVQGAKQPPAGAFNLMPILALDEKKCSSLQRDALAVNPRCAGAGKHIQPLICRTMTVRRASLSIARADRHRGRLSAPVGQYDTKALAKPKMLSLHHCISLKIGGC